MQRRALVRGLAAVAVAVALTVPAAAPVAAEVGDQKIDVTMSHTAHPVGGSTFTFMPDYADGFVPPDDAVCTWEIRWGDFQSIHDNVYNETFGSVAIRGKARDGFCGAWTFTLPYSASGEWLYGFGIGDAPGYYFDTTSFQPGPGFPTVKGTNGVQTGSAITSSNLPGVWLSMPKGTIIGDRVTVTAHPFGGYVLPPSGAYWDAYSASCGCNEFARADLHSLTWTFTVTIAGTIAVFYNDHGEMDGTNFAGAGIDPSVKAVRRVVLHVATTVHRGTAAAIYARTFLFIGRATYVWYIDGRKAHVGNHWTHKFWALGKHRVTVVATDAHGHRAKKSLYVTVVP